MKQTNIFLEALKANYNKVCNDYVQALMARWELSTADGWWAGDEPGTVYCHEADIFISMADIRLCIERDVPLKEYLAWSGYCTRAKDFGYATPSLSAWLKGCPRVGSDTLKKLEALCRDFNEAVHKADPANRSY